MKRTWFVAIAALALGARSASAECVRFESAMPPDVTGVLIARLTERGLLVDGRCPRIANVAPGSVPGELHLVLHDGLGPDRTLDATSLDHVAAFIEAWSALAVVDPQAPPSDPTPAPTPSLTPDPTPTAATTPDVTPPGIVMPGAPGSVPAGATPEVSAGVPLDLDAGFGIMSTAHGDVFPMLSLGLCLRRGGTCLGLRGYISPDSGYSGHYNGVRLEARFERVHPGTRMQAQLSVGVGNYELHEDADLQLSGLARSIAAGGGVSIPMRGAFALEPSFELGVVDGDQVGTAVTAQVQLTLRRRSR